MLRWRALVEEFKEFMWNLKARPHDYTDGQLLHLLEEAQKDWKLSQAYFDDVVDNELIDHAIYTMEAAEQRYSYLLKKAKEEKITSEAIRLA